MAKSKIAIVGSGLVGTTIAYLLTKQGHEVTIFEKGPDYPYPHATQHQEVYFHNYNNPAYIMPPDLKRVELSGDYQRSLTDELHMMVGGMATNWTGITVRMRPNDFKMKTLYGVGDDWPITYEMLEPYYSKAEKFLGVAGTDADNPFAPPRSQPYPLPPFEFSYDDQILNKKLRDRGITIHTTPQARTSVPYEGRPTCDNYGPCRYCPTGARYSPNHHLQLAEKTGLCTVLKNVSVRRVILDETGKAKAIVYRANDESTDQEFAADLIVLGAGAIESARLLLLSKDSRHADGIGNNSGLLGKNLTFHHFWEGNLRYKEALYPGRTAVDTGQSHQFLDPPARGKHGGIKVEFCSRLAYKGNPTAWQNAASILEDLKPVLHSRVLGLHAEALPGAEKYLTLADQQVDRFGDPFTQIHYKLTEFDQETYRYADSIFKQFMEATEAEEGSLAPISEVHSVWHHMGTCRMGENIRDSVVDSFGKVHEVPNLFVVGSGSFVTPSPMNPTLTIAALTIRTAEYLADQVLKG
ncbi:GMC family oxidoreductase [Phormidium tenue FACHB-886]|nr:GMC family oxidoreductase [Phormidium tenue FACHB-886]